MYSVLHIIYTCIVWYMRLYYEVSVRTDQKEGIMNTVYTPEGKAVNFDFAVMLMDDELREEVHAEFAPCDNQKFLMSIAWLIWLSMVRSSRHNECDRSSR